MIDPAWTDEELAILYRDYPTKGAAPIAAQLGRSRQRVKAKAARHGLRVLREAKTEIYSKAATIAHKNKRLPPPPPVIPAEIDIFAGIDFGSEPSPPARYRRPPQRPATHVETQSGLASCAD